MVGDDPHYTCPECFAGKHRNCDGTALDFVHDLITKCWCYLHAHDPEEAA